ncbi:MAG: SDR family oxidoreductase [Alphaproteobacteria bacterium]|nr:SDR family oxidoreductase [Alphaproteobacteria bacterium]
MRIMCFGYGKVIAAWHQQLAASRIACRFSASVRHRDKAERLSVRGVTPYLWDQGLDADGITVLRSAEIVVISAPPSPEGDVLYSNIAPILQYSTALRWLGYLSSTNVYGNHDGRWVNEDTPPNPTGERGIGRVRAEAQWCESGLPAHVFRLAGIYGVGRNQLCKLQSGRAEQLIKTGHVFNRIHEADIAQTISASIATPKPGRVYNLADDCPAPPQDVLRYAATLCGVPLPPPEDYASAALKGLAREFYLDNKRIDNRRIKTELSVELLYPDYRLGLEALWREKAV